MSDPTPETASEATYEAFGFILRRLSVREMTISAAATLLIMMWLSTITEVRPQSVGVAFVLTCLNSAGVRLFPLRNWILLLPVAALTSVALNFIGPIVGVDPKAAL